jgi:archaellum component FlaC
METMRPTWTDERLDDLNARVTEIRDDGRKFRTEVREEFKAVRRELREELRGEIGGLRGEIGELKRTIIQVGGGLIGTLVLGILGLIGSQL